MFVHLVYTLTLGMYTDKMPLIPRCAMNLALSHVSFKPLAQLLVKEFAKIHPQRAEFESEMDNYRA